MIYERMHGWADRERGWIICCWFLVFYFGGIVALFVREFSVSFILAFYMIFSQIFCFLILSFSYFNIICESIRECILFV